MPKLGKIDFSDVKDSGFTPIPAGQWEGQTAGWEVKEANDGQSLNILGKFKFDVEQEDENGELEHRTRNHTQYYSLKPAALWRIKRDFIAMGAAPEDLEGEEVDLEALCQELFGARPVAVLGTFVTGTWTRKNRTTGEEETVPSSSMEAVEAL